MNWEIFLPHINEICLNVGLYTEFEYTTEKATLYIKDCDNPEVERSWNTPVKIPALKGCDDIQAIGGSQTFARRYLYMMAFEIAETDIVDKAEVDEDRQEAEKKNRYSASQCNTKKHIEETETEINSFLEYAGVKRLEDIKNKDYPELLKLLEKKKNDIKKRKEHEEKIKKATRAATKIIRRKTKKILNFRGYENGYTSKQTITSKTMNFEEVKANLVENMEKNIKGIVVTEESLKDCKATQRDLAGLRNKIDSYRKDGKRKWKSL